MAGKVVSLNIGGNVTVYGGLYQLLADHKPVLVLLQEVKVSSEDLTAVFRGMGYAGVSSLDPVVGLGVGALWREGVETEVLHVVPGRLLVVNIGGESFVNVYAPSGKARTGERRELFGGTLVELLKQRPRLLMGDWNCVVAPGEVAGDFGHRDCPMLRELLLSFDMVDAFSGLHPGAREYTWRRRGAGSARLDRLYVPRRRLGDVVAVSHVVSLSDHDAVIASLRLAVGPVCMEKRMRPYWKLNVAMLGEEDFLAGVKRLVSKLLLEREEFGDIVEWWEHCVKAELRLWCRMYGARRARMRRDTVGFLYSLLSLAVEQGDWTEVGRLRMELKKFVLEDMMGVVVRGRTMDMAQEEMASLNHVNRERKAGKNNIGELRVDGVVSRDPAKIEEAVLGFFKPLLTGTHGPGGGGYGSAICPGWYLAPLFPGWFARAVSGFEGSCGAGDHL